MSFRFVTPVRFADIDHAGIVYYPRFFHLFQLAFEELWRARRPPRGYADLLDVDRFALPAVRAECDFKAPLRFGDMAEIELTVARIGVRSITFRYRVYRAEEGERTLCADGKVVAAAVDMTRFAGVAVPEGVVALLQDLVEAPT